MNMQVRFEKAERSAQFQAFAALGGLGIPLLPLPAGSVVAADFKIVVGSCDSHDPQCTYWFAPTHGGTPQLHPGFRLPITPRTRFDINLLAVSQVGPDQFLEVIIDIDDQNAVFSEGDFAITLKDAAGQGVIFAPPDGNAWIDAKTVQFYLKKTNAFGQYVDYNISTVVADIREPNVFQTITQFDPKIKNDG